MMRLRIAGAVGATCRRARAATDAVAHTDPPSNAAPAAPERRRNALRVSPSDPSIDSSLGLGRVVDARAVGCSAGGGGGAEGGEEAVAEGFHGPGGGVGVGLEAGLPVP